MKKWAAWELCYLREHWPAMSDEEIGKELGRSACSVRTTRYHHDIRIDPAEWSAEDDAYILEHWKDQSDEETGAALSREPHAVYQRGVSLGLMRRGSPTQGKRPWTAEETAFLRENWGHMTVEGLSKHLNRSHNAILVRKHKLGLGAYLDNGDYITLNQLMLAVTGTHTYSYQMKSWVENRGMPIRYKRINEKRVRVIYLEDFWEWAEKNRSFIDFSKMEPLALGMEPDGPADVFGDWDAAGYLRQALEVIKPSRRHNLPDFEEIVKAMVAESSEKECPFFEQCSSAFCRDCVVNQWIEEVTDE